MPRRKTFRVNADSVDTLRELLVGTPEDFNHPNDKLRGQTDMFPMAGRLNGSDYDFFMGCRAQHRISYVIYSYTTPIAYRIYDRAFPSPDNPQRWVMPNDPPMTNTTQKHLAKVRAALSQISGGIDNA